MGDSVRLSKAFLWVSLFSYVGMLSLVVSSVQVIQDIGSTKSSGVISSLLFVVMMMISLIDNKLNLIWCGVFGAWAFVSFLGIIQWYNHLGTMNLNVPMAIWDLAIGVSMYLESELYVD